jgi:hypothetical protein
MLRQAAVEISSVKLPDVAVATTSSAVVGATPPVQVPLADQLPPALDIVHVAMTYPQN